MALVAMGHPPCTLWRWVLELSSVFLGKEQLGSDFGSPPMPGQALTSPCGAGSATALLGLFPRTLLFLLLFLLIFTVFSSVC